MHRTAYPRAPRTRYPATARRAARARAHGRPSAVVMALALLICAVVLVYCIGASLAYGAPVGRESDFALAVAFLTFMAGASVIGAVSCLWAARP